MHETMLAHCHAAGLIDFDRVIPDGSHVRAKKDIPGPWMSSSGGMFGGWRLCGDLAVGGAGFEAAVQDSDEAVGELA